MSQRDPVEREVIVERDRSGSSGALAMLIIGVLAIALLVWVFLNLGGGEGDVIPDEVNIDVTTDTAG